MPNYTFFSVANYNNICVLTWDKSAGKRALLDGDPRAELQTLLSTDNSRCVVVSFSQLEQCPSSLMAALVGLRRLLTESGRRLALCEMNPAVRGHFTRLRLDQVFEIYDMFSLAVTPCDNRQPPDG